jgi:hypothetical protein
MIIDHTTKTITIENATDIVPVMNYLYIYLRADERKEWKLRKTNTVRNVEARQATGNNPNQVRTEGRD